MKKKLTQEEKRAKKAKKQHLRNKAILSTIKNIIKKAVKAIQTKKENLDDYISEAYKVIDKAVSKGVVHKNFAARKKSRLMALLKKLKPTKK